MRRIFKNYNEVLSALKTFDLDAFDHLYLTSREELYGYSLSFIKDEVAAEDLVQQVFIDFWEGRKFLDIEFDLIGYLMKMVRNRSLNYIKSDKVQKRRQQEYADTRPLTAEGPDKMENLELGLELDKAMGKLQPMQEKVFRMHYIEKLSYREIADQLQISQATISNHISRALKILRENLKKS